MSKRTDAAASPEAGMVALYRFFDRHEALLYVGISTDPWRRRREHLALAAWYPRVRHQSVTWYPSEAAARRAESYAIRSEAPCFNIAGAIRPPRPRVRIRIEALAKAGTGLGLAAFGGVFAVLAWPVLAPALVPLVVIASLAFPVVMWSLVAICCAPVFGAWIDRNAVWPKREGAR